MLFALCFWGCSAFAEQHRIILAVLDPFDRDTVHNVEAQAFAARLRATLAANPSYDVLETDQMRGMVRDFAPRIELSCLDNDCLLRLARFLGVERLIVTEFSDQQDGLTSIKARLFDSEQQLLIFGLTETYQPAAYDTFAASFLERMNDGKRWLDLSFKATYDKPVYAFTTQAPPRPWWRNRTFWAVALVTQFTAVAVGSLLLMQ